MSVKQKILYLVGDYKIVGVGLQTMKEQEVTRVHLAKKIFTFSEDLGTNHKVFFDIYNKETNQFYMLGFAYIERDWIDLGYKNRNKIKDIIKQHFASEYDIGNFRNYLKK